jgi:hypothetical protein
VPRSIISFGFKDFKEGTTFRGLSEITSRIEDFFSKAGAGIGTATGVFKVVEIAGVLEIAGAIETGAIKGVGLEATFCARNAKTVS